MQSSSCASSPELTLAGYHEELMAELEAFDRDLGKLYQRMQEIHTDAKDVASGKPLWDFRAELERARERVAGAWRDIKWAQEQLKGQ